MKPLHGDAKVRTCADADEELDRLSRDLAAERVRAEKAEAGRDEARAESGKYAAEVGRAIALGSLDGLLCQIGVERHERERAEATLAAAQKRTETLEGALRDGARILRDVQENEATLVVGHPLGPILNRVENINTAALASPSESAPPNDQGAGAAPPAAPLRCPYCEVAPFEVIADDGEVAHMACQNCLMKWLPEYIEDVAGPPSPAPAQPPAPQEGLFEKGARAMREARPTREAMLALQRAEYRRYLTQPPAPQEGRDSHEECASMIRRLMAYLDSYHPTDIDKSAAIGVTLANARALLLTLAPPPAEPSAPQAVAAPPAKAGRCSVCGANRMTMDDGSLGACSYLECHGPMDDYRREHPEDAAPPIEKQLSGKGHDAILCGPNCPGHPAPPAPVSAPPKEKP